MDLSQTQAAFVKSDLISRTLSEDGQAREAHRIMTMLREAIAVAEQLSRSSVDLHEKNAAQTLLPSFQASLGLVEDIWVSMHGRPMPKAS